ncbi:Uncharacterized protein TCM_000434 [Theobroma cacao]|uniref:Uncharacterized protein n=1 Tax=Theobroma cacao TaxID=3641 RepID=A0A061DFX8_THECC|nr:Uncharacterized protein TCM_000434 [Theobroma cacao]
MHDRQKAVWWEPVVGHHPHLPLATPVTVPCRFVGPTVRGNGGVHLACQHEFHELLRGLMGSLACCCCRR